MKRTLCLLFAMALLLCACGGAGDQYREAGEAMERGDYAAAAESFAALGDYEDAADRAKEARYRLGLSLLEQGDYAAAAESFYAAADYEDAPEQACAARLAQARSLLDEGREDEAEALLLTLPEEPEAGELLAGIGYGRAMAALEQGDYAAAAEGFAALADYADAAAQADAARLLQVRSLLDEGREDEARELLQTLPEAPEARALLLGLDLRDLQPGDELRFGRFEQDNDESNGPEEILWRVLDRDGDRLLLVSVYALDSRPYNEPLYGETDWAGCTLRAWLNGAFWEGAFDEAEQLLTPPSVIPNPDNPLYHTPGGADTEDRVFLLSLDEVERYLSGTDAVFAPATAYADARGGVNNGLTHTWWWLRSPGVYSYDACYVAANGESSLYGYIVSRSHWSVRPAIWLDLGLS